MSAEAIAYGIMWLVVAVGIALLDGNDGKQDYRRFSLAFSAALFWPVGLLVIVAVVPIALIGFVFYGFYLWGRLASRVAANYLRRKGTSE